MSVPTTPRAYDDCFEVYDKALADPIGIRVKMKDFDAANHFRQRMHSARKIDRQRNAFTYEMDHPMFNASAWDCLYLTIEHDHDAGHFVYIRKRPVPQEIERLSDIALPSPEEEPPTLAPPVDDLVDAEVVEAPLQITSIRRV